MVRYDLWEGVIELKADKAKVTRLLKTARGQLDGLLKMVEEDRYCVEISNQLMATQAILSNVNRQILRAHLGSCVEEALEKGEGHQKIEEIMDIMDRLSR